MPAFPENPPYSLVDERSFGSYSDRRIIDYTNLYIKNLGENVTSQDLHNGFSQFGKIISAQVMCDQNTGKSLGYGFVFYANEESAKNAIEKMNEISFHGNMIYVNYHSKGKTVYKFKLLFSKFCVRKDHVSQYFDTWEDCLSETFHFLYKTALSEDGGVIDLERKILKMMEYTYIFDNQERPELSPEQIALIYQWFGKTGVPVLPIWSIKKILDVLVTSPRRVEIVPKLSATGGKKGFYLKNWVHSDFPEKRMNYYKIRKERNDSRFKNHHIDVGALQ